MSGKVCTADMTGVMPWTAWNQMGKKYSVTKTVELMKKAYTHANISVRCLAMCGGIVAFSLHLHSLMQKAMARIPKTTRRAMILPFDQA